MCSGQFAEAAPFRKRRRSVSPVPNGQVARGDFLTELYVFFRVLSPLRHPFPIPFPFSVHLPVSIGLFIDNMVSPQM